MNPLDHSFATLKQRGGTAFMPFVTVGDPNPECTVDILLTLQEAGASMIELGIPYSDPLADGPVIQRSSQRALKNSVTLTSALECAQLAKQQGLTIPLLLFTYYNPLLQLGLHTAFERMSVAGIDGIIIPDLPYEENERVRALSETFGIHLIPMVALTSKDRVPKIVERAAGFIYCVSSFGVTGMRSQLHTELEAFVRYVKEVSGLPAVVGFGISTSEQYREVSRYADGVVVGSAIVHAIEQQRELWLDPDSRAEAAHSLRSFTEHLISK
ncbi:tryptophan synthase subunit alpha [Paenibacillus hexagrammi]|uniref:Tryptophan synthase alpha chain n=1 Tax=Paenibacillus hexagrammi TaxID=2908839 RepID=A0ABY3SBE3_9BACL|nr:tryptophan synthase subunit alpha [Paenibacillus sp. YPD9-1]UJF31309.1 tryptophan synthase subunit alpha [Paenibacillus sp. YPD9-1]